MYVGGVPGLEDSTEQRSTTIFLFHSISSSPHNHEDYCKPLNSVQSTSVFTISVLWIPKAQLSAVPSTSQMSTQTQLSPVICPVSLSKAWKSWNHSKIWWLPGELLNRWAPKPTPQEIQIRYPVAPSSLSPHCIQIHSTRLNSHNELFYKWLLVAARSFVHGFSKAFCCLIIIF